MKIIAALLLWLMLSLPAIAQVTNAMPTAADPLYPTGKAAPLSMTLAGYLRVMAQISGTVTVQGTVTANQGTSPWVVSTMSTTGGCTPYHLSGGTAASTNSTSMVSGAHTLCDLTLINTTAVVYYLKVYDSSGAPTCSSATNIKHVYPIPASVTSTGAGIQRSLPGGEAYANGIGFCVTGGGGDADNTNAATGVYIEGSYK